VYIDRTCDDKWKSRERVECSSQVVGSASSNTRRFTYSGTELNAMAEARNYQDWILSYICTHLRGKVIEVGAGMGTFSRLILRLPDVTHLTAIEPADNLFSLLLEQVGSDARVKPLKGYLSDVGTHSEADALIAVNVIEHVEDDKAFLLSAHRALVPGGTCILFAPAMQWLYGSLDGAFGHFRRYSKGEFAQKLTTAGFQVEELRYFNLPGVLAWFVAGRVLKKTTLQARDTRLYDRCVVPWISRLERFVEPLIGQSVLAVARKPLGDA